MAGISRKGLLRGAPSELNEVILALAVFLGPVAEALHASREIQRSLGGAWPMV